MRFFIREEVTKILWNPFFLKCTSNKIFTLNAFWQNWKILDITVYSGHIREVLILKNSRVFASKRFSRRNFAFSEIFPIGIKNRNYFSLQNALLTKSEEKKVRVVAIAVHLVLICL